MTLPTVSKCLFSSSIFKPVTISILQVMKLLSQNTSSCFSDKCALFRALGYVANKSINLLNGTEKEISNKREDIARTLTGFTFYKNVQATLGLPLYSPKSPKSSSL